MARAFGEPTDPSPDYGCARALPLLTQWSLSYPGFSPLIHILINEQTIQWETNMKKHPFRPTSIATCCPPVSHAFRIPAVIVNHVIVSERRRMRNTVDPPPCSAVLLPMLSHARRCWTTWNTLTDMITRSMAETPFPMLDPMVASALSFLHGTSAAQARLSQCSHGHYQ
jgi:hypothetical protein